MYCQSMDDLEIISINDESNDKDILKILWRQLNRLIRRNQPRWTGSSNIN